MSTPLVSVVLSVKNAMPQVRQTMEALKRQTYRNFEIIVQDGKSTDETMEYLKSVTGLPPVEIVSEPDNGIGQAYNRGLARSRGDLICIIAADEWLDDDALGKGVQWFQSHPNASVIYGGMRLVDETGRVFQIFIAPPFDWTKVINNETAIPITASFLNRKRIGADLYYDESLKTCPDYDFWLRLGSKHDASQFIRVPEPILTALADRTSMSFRAESFPQFTRDKLFILNRYLAGLGEGKDVAALRATASAGILAWAAENVLRLEGVTPNFLKWCQEAARFDPRSVRLTELARASDAFETGASGEFIVKPAPQPRTPQGPTRPVDGALKLEGIRTETWWEGARVQPGTVARVTTASTPWTFSALIPLDEAKMRDPASWYWIKLELRVLSGEAGISLFAADQIHDEQTIASEDGRVSVFIRLKQRGASGVMIRTGSRSGPAVVEIYGAAVECGGAAH